MKRLLLGPLLCFTAVLLAAGASAEAPSASVSVVPEGELTVGDPVEIRVSVIHEAGARVLMDGSVVQMGGMEPSAPVITEVSETETLVVFQTRAFASGRFDVELPAIPIQRADRSLSELRLRQAAITITSVLDGQSEPRPITGPDLLQGDDRTLTPWIVGIIGIGLGFVLARLLRRRYRRPAVVAGIADGEIAMSESVTFELDAALEPAEQCRRLSTAVRSRLGEDWSLPASALTSSEIGPALAAAGAPGAVVLRVTRLLEACDRAQFGGELPTTDRLSGYVQLAEAIWADGDSS
ncbi:MAG: hypothetical protein OXI41_11115 [Chloroflexota bacterium]|nr:hypothetical protein [Chloroflexota bacterium]MDE2895247.1 hypothetical protein [Chloroflexota bacterium]